MAVTTITQGILDRVQGLYEVHPYPKYPLLSRPRWQDGYLAHSRLAQCLAGSRPDAQAEKGVTSKVVIGGAGEILPYIVRQWEARDQSVISVDLSSVSLKRAKIRLFPLLKPSSFVRGDLGEFLSRSPAASVSHVDVFGVLHHMADPSAVLHSIARVLQPGGTVRLMVYNSTARRWIHHLQRAFDLLGLDGRRQKDFELAAQLIAVTQADAPSLIARLKQVGASTLTNPARFADLFLHPREARIGITRWMNIIGDASLKVVGLFDRYGELDDLPNPLWHPPALTDLESRAQDLRFEGNLEIFLQKPGGIPLRFPTKAWLRSGRFAIGTGPGLWWSFSETASLTLWQRSKIWRAHLAHIDAKVNLLTESDFDKMPPSACKRLARLGAILPGQFPAAYRAEGHDALVLKLEAPHFAPPMKPLSPTARLHVESILSSSHRLSPKRLNAVLSRLAASRF